MVLLMRIVIIRVMVCLSVGVRRVLIGTNRLLLLMEVIRVSCLGNTIKEKTTVEKHDDSVRLTSENAGGVENAVSAVYRTMCACPKSKDELCVNMVKTEISKGAT